MFIEILFKMLLFKGGVLIYAEHCIYEQYHMSRREIRLDISTAVIRPYALV